MAVVTKNFKSVNSEVVHPSSFRLSARTNDRLNYYSQRMKRKKISLLDEALNKLFDEEEKKEAEDIELIRLLEEGDKSGSTGGIPTLKEIKLLAKKRYPHNHSE